VAIQVDVLMGERGDVRDLAGGDQLAEHPSWLRAHPRDVRLTLLACFCFSRTTEITDTLVDLLIATVHKMDVRADYRVEQELLADLKHVRGKRGILFALAQAAVDHPDDIVRRAIWAGGRRADAARVGARGSRPTIRHSGRGCARCCAPPTEATTARCFRPCSERFGSAATTPPTGR